MSRRLVVLPLAALLALPLVSATPALASGGGGGVRASGACSARAHWSLRAKPDDGRLEVQAEVDTDVAGQHWAWRLLDDGVRVASGIATTTAASGSFSVRRVVADRAGTDTVRLQASDAATGQTCTGAVRL